MEDTKDPELNLTLFYSNSALCTYKEAQYNNTMNVIYYNWLIDMAKKMENVKVVFTFTRENGQDFFSDHPRIIYRKGRFFFNPDATPERVFQSITGILSPHLTQYAEAVDSLTGLLNVLTEEWREEGE